MNNAAVVTDFKINERLHAHASDFFQIAAAGDANHERGKNQRTDDRLDQVKKNVAQEKNFVAPLRPQPTDAARRRPVRS